jgi:hypothetical protein
MLVPSRTLTSKFKRAKNSRRLFKSYNTLNALYTLSYHFFYLQNSDHQILLEIDMQEDRAMQYGSETSTSVSCTQQEVCWRTVGLVNELEIKNCFPGASSR